MHQLNNKTILILSPQAWGKMFISKHHYAIELANLGNKVYFLNPPNDPKPNERVVIKPSEINKNLFIVETKLFFSYNLKFRLLPVFHFLMRWQIEKIGKSIPAKIDIVWSFDIGYTYPLYFFPKSALKVFHPVDEPLSKEAINSAKGANIIFSVTTEILDKYAQYAVPRRFINHGLSEKFIRNNNHQQSKNDIARVGFSGNLMRKDIDIVTLLSIIRENPLVEFDFFGPYKVKDSNIGGADDEQQAHFVQQLQQQSNVTMHGVVSSLELANEYEKMDAFLICYDVQKDQSKGTNYHKIMEYISTGKVIISNNVTTYKKYPDLVQMVVERDSNKQLPQLFKDVVKNLSFYNSDSLCKKRKEFALQNTYSKQIERIAEQLQLLEQ